VPVNLGPAVNVASWTHRGGSATHLLPHATLSAQPQLIWSTKAGAGNSRKNRITAEPVSDGSLIFAMGAETTVTAVSLGGGALWSTSLTPARERQGGGMGGGLALGDGKLFATTTFGELVALDPASGAVLWRQDFNSPVSGAPTVSNGQVYVTTANSNGYAVNSATGRIIWQLSGMPTNHGVSGVAAPAAAGNLAIFPLANGSLMGVDRGDGSADWVARVAGARPGRGSAVLQDFTADPVVSGGTVYAGTPAGRTVAVSLGGDLLWTADEGAQGMMAVAGGSVFFVTDEAKLVRLSARDGDKIWSVDLPRYTKDKPRRLKSIFPSYGPVLASGKLWVASGDGYLRSFNPVDGSLLSITELPDGAASRPITVNGMLVLMTERGNLVALR
jgi:outer membrane protein assembly factor BamB